jgi:hypothetical protein
MECIGAMRINKKMSRHAVQKVVETLERSVKSQRLGSMQMRDVNHNGLGFCAHRVSSREWDAMSWKPIGSESAPAKTKKTIIRPPPSRFE